MEELILTKARELFFSYGLKSVSMDDLAKHAAISKKTIYQFFSDKESLVSCVIDQLMEQHHELFCACQQSAPDAVGEVILQSRAPFETWTTRHSGFYYELQKYYPLQWAKLEAHRSKVLVPGIRKNLREGINSGLYRAEINLEVITAIRLQQLTTALSPSTFLEKKIGVDELVHEFTVFYLHGITTAKGKKILDTYLKQTDETQIKKK